MSDLEGILKLVVVVIHRIPSINRLSSEVDSDHVGELYFPFIIMFHYPERIDVSSKGDSLRHQMT